MDYLQSLDYVQGAKARGAVKQGLTNITELLRRLGNPEARFPCVHVAGTNGKGSVCALLESMLRAGGHKTGLYTSPYLERFPERIRVGGQEIAEEAFADAATQVHAAAQGMVADGLGEPTFFELVTAAAFLHFYRNQVDIAIIETGLGGRTDATNAVTPLLSVITAVGMDHAASLGGTLRNIAAEKAGILKPGVPAVLSAGNPPDVVAIVKGTARQLGCPLTDCADWQAMLRQSDLEGEVFDLAGGGTTLQGLNIRLLGSHQVQNAVVAVAAVQAIQGRFKVPESALRAGLQSAQWPGRLELLRREPPLLLDGAHNPHGAAALAQFLRQHFGSRQACLVFASMNDKDAAGMAEALAPVTTQVIATEPPGHGARMVHSAKELADLFATQGVPTQTEPDWQDAIKAALAGGLPVVICGSLYLVGAARRWLRGQKPYV